MAVGPGRYDKYLDQLWQEIKPEAAVLIVVKPKKHGMSVKGPPGFDEALPEFLIRIANMMLEERNQNKKN